MIAKQEKLNMGAIDNGVLSLNSMPSVLWCSHRTSTGASYITWYIMFCYQYFATLVVASGCCSLSFFPSRERFAAPTGFCCVWILERETATNERVTVVQLHSKHEKKAFWVTDCRTKGIPAVRIGSF